ncbi:MAG: hypothetical protein ABOK23_06680 [Candidatus Methanoperedens sp.]|nr:hypothetical protein [Candidatus Methanoperedens sp.]MCZ7395595.1 hypothetical protein [Candidatus Methanoperedens sp.]
MLDIHSLPLGPKIILLAGLAIGITSFILFLRYPILLILMKFKPEYREFIKRSLMQKKLRKQYHEKNSLRDRQCP